MKKYTLTGYIPILLATTMHVIRSSNMESTCDVISNALIATHTTDLTLRKTTMCTANTITRDDVNAADTTFSA